MMKSSSAGIGFLIDQVEKFMANPSLRRDDTHGVAIGEETTAGDNHLRVGVERRGQFDAVANTAADVDLLLPHLVVLVDREEVAEAVTQQHRGLRQRQAAAAADVELTARNMPALTAGVSGRST